MGTKLLSRAAIGLSVLLASASAATAQAPETRTPETRTPETQAPDSRALEPRIPDTLAPRPQAAKEITFGIVAPKTAQDLKDAIAPFVEDMAKDLGVKVTPSFAPDYQAIIEGLRTGDLDMAWLGNNAALAAVDSAHAEIFAQIVDTSGNAGYRSLLLANAENAELDALPQVLTCDQSLEFGYGPEGTMASYLVPNYYIFERQQIDPAACFSGVRYETPEANAIAVADGRLDLATSDTLSLEQLRETDPGPAAKLKVIWRSPTIPGDAMLYRANLSRDRKARIKGFFLSYGRLRPNDKKRRDTLTKIGIGWAPFIDSDNMRYYPLRQLLLVRDRFLLEADEKISPQDRAEKMAAIEAQLQILDVLMENPFR